MNREIKSQQQLNLATLSRLDPAIVEVLGNSGHVAVYKFDDLSKTWQRKDAEGSLFIVKRSEQPVYRIVVLNRLSTDNLVEDIKANLLLQLNGPYLIYRNTAGETNGIWFYEQSDRDKIAQQIESVKSDLQRPRSDTEPQISSKNFAFGHSTAFTSYPPQPVNTPQPQSHLHFLPTLQAIDASQLLFSSSTPPATLSQPNNLSQKAVAYDESSGSKLLSPSIVKSIMNTPTFSIPAPPSNPANSTNLPPISKHQLQQALLRLAQDETFIDLVYNEYLSKLT